MANTVKDSAATRKVAILAADGVDGEAVAAMKQALLAAARCRRSWRPAAAP